MDRKNMDDTEEAGACGEEAQEYGAQDFDQGVSQILGLCTIQYRFPIQRT